MNKEQLVNTVSQYLGVPKYKTEEIITATINAITDALSQGESVKLVGFGQFTVKERSARVGRNPKTNEQVHIPAMRKPVFLPGKGMKNAVKENNPSDNVM